MLPSGELATLAVKGGAELRCRCGTSRAPTPTRDRRAQTPTSRRRSSIGGRGSDGRRLCGAGRRQGSTTSTRRSPVSIRRRSRSRRATSVAFAVGESTAPDMPRPGSKARGEALRLAKLDGTALAGVALAEKPVALAVDAQRAATPYVLQQPAGGQRGRAGRRPAPDDLGQRRSARAHRCRPGPAGVALALDGSPVRRLRRRRRGVRDRATTTCGDYLLPHACPHATRPTASCSRRSAGWRPGRRPRTSPRRRRIRWPTRRRASRASTTCSAASWCRASPTSPKRCSACSSNRAAARRPGSTRKDREGRQGREGRRGRQGLARTARMAGRQDGDRRQGRRRPRLGLAAHLRLQLDARRSARPARFTPRDALIVAFDTRDARRSTSTPTPSSCSVDRRERRRRRAAATAGATSTCAIASSSGSTEVRCDATRIPGRHRRRGRRHAPCASTSATSCATSPAATARCACASSSRATSSAAAPARQASCARSTPTTCPRSIRRRRRVPRSPACCRVAAPATAVSGDGIEGGTFESWFTVASAESARDHRRIAMNSMHRSLPQAPGHEPHDAAHRPSRGACTLRHARMRVPAALLRRPGPDRRRPQPARRVHPRQAPPAQPPAARLGRRQRPRGHVQPVRRTASSSAAATR